MKGLKSNEVTLFLGELPNRKSLCFYFAEGTALIPLAYVPVKNTMEAIRLWQKFMGESEDTND